MKNLTTPLIVIFAMTCAFGCKKIESAAKYQAPQMPDIEKIKKDAQQKAIRDLFYAGGQPGVISISGIGVNDGKLDARISTSQQAGKSKDGQQTKINLKTAVELNSLESASQEGRKSVAKSLEKERTYINLGCELSESETAGLTDATEQINIENINALTATRIFICGKQKWNVQMDLTIWASDILLKDADVTYKKGSGTISLNANTLSLIGKNLITTSSVNSVISVSPAANLSLFVGHEIYGDGQLNLNSQGADCVTTWGQ